LEPKKKESILTRAGMLLSVPRLQPGVDLLWRCALGLVVSTRGLSVNIS
jgi:hypothetical protein